MRNASRNLLVLLGGVVFAVCLLQVFLIYDAHSRLDRLELDLGRSAFADRAANITNIISDITLVGLSCSALVLFSCFIVYQFFSEQAADRLRAHKETAESKARLETLIDAIPDLVYFKDLEGRHLYFNKACEESFGAPRESLVGKTAHDLLPPDMAESCHRGDMAILQGRERVRVEERQLLPDGSAAIMDTIKAPIFDDRGEMIGLVGVSRDVTEQRRLEERVRQSQKIEALGRLAGGVAHDINNYLGAITGYCEHLEMTHAGDPAVLSRVTAITVNAFKAASLVKDLLVFSRQQPMRFEVLDVNAVVALLTRRLEKLLGPAIVFETSLGPDLWDVKADADQVEQVLVNLVTNAREAISGAGKVTVETRNVTVGDGADGQDPLVPAGEYVVVSVSDTGHGIPPEYREKIFDPFFTTRERGLGAGLGLATVYGMVKQHRGQIAVSSEPGTGTTFRIFLPRCAERMPAHAGAARAAQRAEGRGAASRILLVDDNEDVKDAIRSLLNAMGYEVQAASSGEEALSAFDAEPGGFPLVITDVVMPGMGGDEVAARILRKDDRVKVLFISGYTDEAIARHGILPDEVNFLQKPFTASVLRKKIDELLAGASAA